MHTCVHEQHTVTNIAPVTQSVTRLHLCDDQSVIYSAGKTLLKRFPPPKYISGKLYAPLGHSRTPASYLPKRPDITVTKVTPRVPEAGPGRSRAPRVPPRAIRAAHEPGSISPDPGTAPAAAGSAPEAAGALPQPLLRCRGCRRGPQRGPRALSRRAAHRPPAACRDRGRRSHGT